MNAPVSAPELSIIIPAYNEEGRLSRTLARIREYFTGRRVPSGIAPNISVDQLEILIVDDGSKDGTARIAEEWAREMPFVRLVSNGENRGKGYRVRLAAGNDIAIGSRALDRSLISVHQSRHRELAGMVFNGFVRVITGLPFHDTQCGFKIFRREPSRIIFEQQRIERFGFDPEILFLAKRHGLRTAEVPVRWAHDAGTKVQVLRDSVMMFCDLLVIRWNWLLRRYPRKNDAR